MYVLKSLVYKEKGRLLPGIIRGTLMIFTWFEIEIQYDWPSLCLCVDKLCLQNKWRHEQLSWKNK